ncbi:MAG: hypothetical protein V2I33_17235 [Kangiellaceae bacterium]|nr:hypothetical protein [Kangiellaceae bacterium]
MTSNSHIQNKSKECLPINTVIVQMPENSMVSSFEMDDSAVVSAGADASSYKIVDSCE